jgi:hypothetical protein
MSTYTLLLYDSESQTWRSGDAAMGGVIRTLAVAIEAGGFRILRFVET